MGEEDAAADCQRLRLELESVRKELTDRIKHYEGKLVTLTVINGALQGENDKLRDENARLLEEGDGREHDDAEDAKAELAALQEEFAQRLGQAERQVQASQAEAARLRQELQDATTGSGQIQAHLEQKDTLIVQLTREGEALAKNVGKLEGIVARLRVSEKDWEVERERLAAKVALLDADLSAACMQRDAALLDAKLQAETLQLVLAQHKEEIAAFQAEAESRARALAERARNEAEGEGHAALQKMSVRDAALAENLQALRDTVACTVAEASVREDKLRSEIRQLETRCRELEAFSEEALSREVLSMRPLMAQIEALSSQLASQTLAASRVDTDMKRRVLEAEEAASDLKAELHIKAKQATSMEAAVHAAEEAAAAAEAKAARLDSALRAETSCNKDLKEQLDSLQTRMLTADDRTRDALETIARQKQELAVFGTKLSRLTQERDLALEQLKEAQAAASDAKAAAAALAEQAEKKHQLSRQNSVTGKGHSMSNGFATARDEDDPTAGLADDVEGLLRSVPAGVARAAFERLAAKARQQQGAIAQLKEQLNAMEKARDAANEAFCKAQESANTLQADAAAAVRLKQELEKLKKHHEIALTMIGERNERVEELEADMRDVKALFREQINLLVAQVDPTKWPKGYRICLYCHHCAESHKGKT
eukprot:jgi/Chlat1/514/Chrsp103S01110